MATLKQHTQVENSFVCLSPFYVLRDAAWTAPHVPRIHETKHTTFGKTLGINIYIYEIILFFYHMYFISYNFLYLYLHLNKKQNVF